MNRTITMNLSGIIFHIEEDAYEKLNKYLSTIRGYFSTTEGRDEIMVDIESRIAEMLQEKVSQAKQAVLLADVESVIAAMGKPEDFATENEQAGKDNTTENVYNEDRYNKRLFRDPDDRMVSGVCSGIAHYFDIDPVWIRAAFAIAMFVFGTGALLYFVLWMIIPLAKTTAEKLQMRGEKVDINNIGKAVNEEINYLKKRVNKFGEDISSPETREHWRNTARNTGHRVGAVLSSALVVAAKVFSAILLVICVLALTGVLAGIFGKGNFMIFDSNSTVHFSLYEIASSILPVGISAELVVATLILFLGIPLLFIIYSTVRFLFNLRQRNRIVNYVASILWVIGIALVVYIGVLVANDFSTEATVKNKTEIGQPATKKLYLDMITTDDATDDFIHFRHSGTRIRLDNWSIISREGDHYRLGYPQLDIVPSETDNFQLIVLKTAYGPDKKEANDLAKNISYDVIQKDSSLIFNNYFDIADNDKFRAQEVKIILKVPVNKTIYLSKRMERIIFDIENVTNTLDRDMVNRSWIMTQQGLECLDCTGLEETADGRRHSSYHVTVHHDKDDDASDDGHKEIIIRTDKDGTIQTEDIKGTSGKKVIIHKKSDDNEKEIIIERNNG